MFLQSEVDGLESPAENTASALPAKKKGGNPAWVKGMPSPYPTGRTPIVLGGRKNIRTLLREKLEDESMNVLTVALDKAKSGKDTRMLTEILKYIMPAQRQVTEMVDLQIPEDWPIEHKLRAINDRALAGLISADQASVLTKSFLQQVEAEKFAQALSELADLKEQIRVVDGTATRVR